MAIPETPPATSYARNLEAGVLLIALGAILLLISLFLEWYEPGFEAWDAFEVSDLVLAALAIAALVAVAGRMGFGVARPNSWLLAPAVVSLVIVLAALIDHPPVADSPGNDPTTGIWLALVAVALMGLGAVLSVAQISVALNVAQPGAAPESRRFGRSAPSPPTADTVPPAAPLGTPPTEPTRRL